MNHTTIRPSPQRPNRPSPQSREPWQPKKNKTTNHTTARPPSKFQVTTTVRQNTNTWTTHKPKPSELWWSRDCPLSDSTWTLRVKWATSRIWISETPSIYLRELDKTSRTRESRINLWLSSKSRRFVRSWIDRPTQLNSRAISTEFMRKNYPISIKSRRGEAMPTNGVKASSWQIKLKPK